MKILILRKLLFAQERFFKDISRESIFTSWMYVSLAAVASMVLSFYAEIPLFIKSEFPRLVIFLNSVSFLWHIPMVIAIPFITAGLSYAGLIAMGGKAGYRKTFIITSYAMFVWYLYTMISTLLLYPVYLADNASPVADLFQSLSALLSFIGLVHFIIIEVKGAMTYHDISWIRAFLGVFMIPLFMIAMFAAFMMLLIFVITIILVSSF